MHGLFTFKQACPNTEQLGVSVFYSPLFIFLTLPATDKAQYLGYPQVPNPIEILPRPCLTVWDPPTDDDSGQIRSTSHVSHVTDVTDVGFNYQKIFHTMLTNHVTPSGRVENIGTGQWLYIDNFSCVIYLCNFEPAIQQVNETNPGCLVTMTNQTF